MAKDFLNIIAMVCGISAAVVVARTSLLKQTIAALEGLVEALEGKNKKQADEIETLKGEKSQLEHRVEALEAIIRGNPKVVGEGHLASGFRCGCGNCAASPKTPKNRHP